MDIYEWSAIEAFKRGDREPLATRWRKLQGKPLSPLLHEFILRHFVEGKPLRGKGAPNKKAQEAQVKMFHSVASLIEPSPKKLAILDTAKKFKLSKKSVERIIYSIKPKPSRRSPKK
jgi:hypothetical protein